MSRRKVVVPVVSARFEPKTEAVRAVDLEVVRTVDVDDVETPTDLRGMQAGLEQEPLSVREMLGFPLRLVSRLPDAATLLAAAYYPRRDGPAGVDAREVVMTTSRVAYEAARAKKWPVFVGGELDWLALGAENERATWAQMKGWLARKLEQPSWRLDGAAALGDFAGMQPPQHWTVGRVFERLGLELIAVGAGDEVPW